VAEADEPLPKDDHALQEKIAKALVMRVPRYCNRCKLFKSPRSFHCRECQRCVLKRDHHCTSFPPPRRATNRSSL
jgi:hypothetical protein